MAPPVAGYTGWYDATDVGSLGIQNINGADRVYQWDDKSGNANHLGGALGDANWKPRYVTGEEINGYICPSFLGTERIDSPLIGGDTTCTVFFLAKLTSDGDFRSLCGGGSNSNLVIRVDSNNSLGLVASHVQNLCNTGYTAVVENEPFACLGRTNGAANSLQQYGNAIVTQNNGTVGGAGSLRFGLDQAAAPWIGQIGEIIYYPITLSDSDCNTVLGYLYDKWIAEPSPLVIIPLVTQSGGMRW